MTQLLAKASRAFAQGIDPFSTDWLVKNDVSLDECMDLSAAISAAIDLMLVGMGAPGGKPQ